MSREESEKVSELKSVLGSSKLPYGTLASGTEGIRDAISGFDDACVILMMILDSSPDYQLSLTVAGRILKTNVFLLTSSTPIQKKARLSWGLLLSPVPLRKALFNLCLCPQMALQRVWRKPPNLLLYHASILPSLLSRKLLPSAQVPHLLLEPREDIQGKRVWERQ